VVVVVVVEEEEVGDKPSTKPLSRTDTASRTLISM
jgi:hypothetical protein